MFHSSLTFIDKALLLPSLWMDIVLVFIVIVVVLIYFMTRLNQLRHQKSELQRQLHEKAELLKYTSIREQKAVEKTAEVTNTKKMLLGRINHDIRTPLNGVMGMVSLLADTTLTPEQREYNQTIRSCGESLLTVINDILLGDVLAHAKMDSSSAELEQKDFDLRNCIEEVFDIFASQAELLDVELVYHVDHRVPSLIRGDNARLRQVLMNLVDNAMRFTKKGEIFINVTIKNRKDNVVDLSFEVRDSGAGIASEQLDFLKHTISRSDALHSGVGLVLCYRLIELMDGVMEIESTLNEGTAVWFNIRTHFGSQAERVYPDRAGLEGKTILIVEDNATLRNVLVKEMEFHKLIPVTAASGKQALEILARESTIDIVLAEMQMPEMDGAALSRQIRVGYPLLPIVLMTATHDEGSKKNPEIFNSVVNKPLRYDSLIQHIASGLLHNNDSNGHTTAKLKLTTDFAQKNPLRILIAEDNRVNQKLAVRILAKLGYDPDIVENGKEVLEEVSKEKYDLILMDVQMPEMDGLEASRMIRLCLDVQPVIVAMTANAMQGDREECLANGMDDYISKPVNIEELVIILEKWASQVKVKV
jgi:CheY-like chemotaxis protein/Na+-transporting methylmalonyl-CoA/oxaloacetate decarboxylase gamma subunit